MLFRGDAYGVDTFFFDPILLRIRGHTVISRSRIVIDIARAVTFDSGAWGHMFFSRAMHTGPALIFRPDEILILY